MARCRECNAKVRRNAEYCQQCGVRYLTKGHLLATGPYELGGKFYFRMIAASFVIVVLAWIGISLGSGSGTPSCRNNWTLCTDKADLLNNYLDSDHKAQIDCQIRAAPGTPNMAIRNFRRLLLTRIM